MNLCQSQAEFSDVDFEIYTLTPPLHYSPLFYIYREILVYYEVESSVQN